MGVWAHIDVLPNITLLRNFETEENTDDSKAKYSQLSLSQSRHLFQTTDISNRHLFQTTDIS